MRNVGTAPTLRNNTCGKNGLHGISFQQGGGGTAEDNTCESNKQVGIFVSHSGTAPTLRANRCNNNGLWGIWYGKGASPIVHPDNTAVGNKQGQITQPASSKPPAQARPRRPPNPLVGTWVAGGTSARGPRQIVIQFGANGQFTHREFLNNVQVSASQGTYAVTQTVITMRTHLRAFTSTYRLHGNILSMRLRTMGGQVQFRRQVGTR